jgi:nucleotide-binding universal stress UspA family protein
MSSATSRTILCATDLSSASRAAVGVAYALAGPGGTVRLLHVIEPLVFASPLDGTYLAYANDPQEQVESEMKALGRLDRLVPVDVPEGVHTRKSVVHDASVPGRILAEAQASGAETIVMGTHGRTGFGRLLMGSVAGDVLRKARIPVVLVHDRQAA